MGPSWVQILIVVVLVVLLFGRGKISDLMGDVATGIKSFRKGLKDEDQSGTAAADSLKTIDNETGEKISPSTPRTGPRTAEPLGISDEIGWRDGPPGLAGV